MVRGVATTLGEYNGDPQYGAANYPLYAILESYNESARAGENVPSLALLIGYGKDGSMNAADSLADRAEWKMLGWYAIPAAPLFVLYIAMGAVPFRVGAELGWWRHDFNTDAGEAWFLFQIAGFLALVILALAIPLITVQTKKGMRLRVNGTATLLLVVALPLIAWAFGLVLWFA